MSSFQELCQSFACKDCQTRNICSYKDSKATSAEPVWSALQLRAGSDTSDGYESGRYLGLLAARAMPSIAPRLKDCLVLEHILSKIQESRLSLRVFSYTVCFGANNLCGLAVFTRHYVPTWSALPNVCSGNTGRYTVIQTASRRFKACLHLIKSNC